VSKCQLDVKRGIIVLKRVKSECRKLTGFSRCPIRLFPDCAAGEAGASRKWCLAASWVGGRGGVGWNQGLSAGAAWCGGPAECCARAGWRWGERGLGRVGPGEEMQAVGGDARERAGASRCQRKGGQGAARRGRKSGSVAWRALGVGRPSLLVRGRARQNEVVAWWPSWSRAAAAVAWCRACWWRRAAWACWGSAWARGSWGYGWSGRTSWAGALTGS
jgi:hypothetical protein